MDPDPTQDFQSRHLPQSSWSCWICEGRKSRRSRRCQTSWRVPDDQLRLSVNRYSWMRCASRSFLGWRGQARSSQSGATTASDSSAWRIDSPMPSPVWAALSVVCFPTNLAAHSQRLASREGSQTDGGAALINHDHLPSVDRLELFSLGRMLLVVAFGGTRAIFFDLVQPGRLMARPMVLGLTCRPCSSSHN